MDVRRLQKKTDRKDLQKAIERKAMDWENKENKGGKGSAAPFQSVAV